MIARDKQGEADEKALNKDNSGTIVLKFDCLIRMAGYQGTILQSYTETFFDYGASRLDMIGNLIDIDLNLKKLQFQLNRQQKTIKDLKKVKSESGQTITGGSAVKERLQFKSHLIQAFRSFETDALENFYLQSTAYRFATLWDFDLFSSYSSALGDTQRLSNINIFNGYAPLKSLSMKLENLKCVYKKCIQRKFNTPKEPLSWLWEFDPKTHTKMFEDIKTNHVTRFTIDKTRICGDDLTACVNLRLKKVYAELEVKDLDTSVVKIIYININHLGDNTFYFPDNKHIKLKNEKISRTTIAMDTKKVTTEQCKGSATTCPSRLRHDDGRWHSACTADVLKADEKMFGSEPCRSPFATYMLRVPMRKEALVSSLGKNGNNLKLDKITKIRFFALIQFWPKKYPANINDGCTGITC